MRSTTIILLIVFAASCSTHKPPQNPKTQATRSSKVDAQPTQQSANVTGMDAEQLIDQLTETGAQAPGLHSTALVSGFIADDARLKFAGGVLGSPPPTVSPQMKELVRRGVTAMPSLIQHLDDKRPTKLTAGGEIIEWAYFSDEYDPKDRSTHDRDNSKKGPVDPRYTVRVGDVCYALVGQIVNRALLPVHYQPTGGMVINSPIEEPLLISQLKRDWNDIDSKAHMESLVADAKAGDHVWFYGPALQRLRFYYPNDYRRQATDTLKTKIQEFESSEDKGK
jgi:hypothetical protein